MIGQFQVYQHPRVPVYRGHRDNLVGFVHAEDVLRLVLDQADMDALTPADIMHPPVVVPLTKKVDEMFDFFATNAARAAACLNEFGGVEGFITMKDVINFIFGEVSGKAVGDELYQEQDENTYIIPGDMKLNFFDDLTNFGIDDPRMTTIGGVAFRHLDRLPKVGDKVTVEGINITILEMDAHRIAKVQVSPAIGLPEEEEGSAEDVNAVPMGKEASLESLPTSGLTGSDTEDKLDQGDTTQVGPPEKLHTIEGSPSKPAGDPAIIKRKTMG